MTLRQLLADAAEAIAAIGAGNPRLEAELLLAHALGRSRVFLMTHPEYEPSTESRESFDALLERRRASEPLQYVLGDAAFRHLMLRVRPGVLIPRAETEVLVDHAWAALQRWRVRRAGTRKPEESGPDWSKPWVIDVGVGSGAILLALMYEALATTGGHGLWFRPLGIDISAIPLAVTNENAGLSGLPRPHLALGDYLGAIRPDASIAGIVSNPPYIGTAEMAELPAEIREFEPHEALHAGPEGLGAIRILLDQARPFLARGAFLCFEIGGLQADAVRRELADRRLLELSRIHPDLAGRPRVVLVEPGAAPSG